MTNFSLGETALNHTSFNFVRKFLDEEFWNSFAIVSLLMRFCNKEMVF